MAHAVGEHLKVQQTLHGYAEGHRLLAGSVNLSAKDMRTLLTMSDISGSGARIDPSGYLTGYPLAESGAYALARTWTAPEMPRPGCVWTHTLLIDFADLATLASLGELDVLFRRPELPSYGNYTKPLSVGNAKVVRALTGDELKWSQKLLSALYGKPRERVIAARLEDVDADASVLAVWSQQWPRLRRGFRFCTLVAADRSSEGNVFDLQLFHPTDRGSKTRFQKAVDANSVTGVEPLWIEEATSDLANPDVFGLRSFLHTAGSDIDFGRAAFGSLCRVHRCLREAPGSANAFRTSIDIITAEFSPNQARAARMAVTKLAVLHAEALDDVAIDFILRHLDLVDMDTVRSRALRLGRAIWKNTPGRLVALRKMDGSSQVVAENTLAALNLQEIIEGLERAPAVASVLLQCRQELACQVGFWAIPGLDIAKVFAELRSDGDKARQVIGAIMVAGRVDLASRCLSRWGAHSVLEVCIEQVVSGAVLSATLTPWMMDAAWDSMAVAAILSSGRPLPWEILVMLARLIEADRVPNEIGDDPWVVAIHNATGQMPGDAQTFFCAYLLCRALGNRSRNPGELARFGFEPTYRAVECNSLPDDSWRALEPRLPWSMFWFGRDRCPRLRVAVVDLFTDRYLAPEIFVGLVESDELFLQLVEMAGQSRKGREYLEMVCSVAKNNSDRPFGYRFNKVKRFLDNH